MGKIIMCSSLLSKQPFIHIETDTYIYSMEELCYFIYNNYDRIENSFFNEELAHWVEKEAMLQKRGKRLLELIQGQSNMKDIIVYILCSTDYYTEREIKELIYSMEDYGLLSIWEKKKKDADNNMRYKKYGKALMLYEEVLVSEEKNKWSVEEVGNIYHNIGVAKAYTKGILWSQEDFKLAYDKNHNPNSLYLYLYSLLLSRKLEEFENSVRLYSVGSELVSKIKEEAKLELYGVERSILQKVTNLRNIKDTKEKNEFIKGGNDLIRDLKANYRTVNHCL